MVEVVGWGMAKKMTIISHFSLCISTCINGTDLRVPGREVAYNSIKVAPNYGELWAGETRDGVCE